MQSGPDWFSNRNWRIGLGGSCILKFKALRRAPTEENGPVLFSLNGQIFRLFSRCNLRASDHPGITLIEGAGETGAGSVSPKKGRGGGLLRERKNIPTRLPA
jgi:hypothetical protein